MHAIARFSKSTLRMLPITIVWLGLTGVAAGPDMTSQGDPPNTTPSTPGAAAENAAPVYIVVSTTPLGGGEFEYSYEVVNGGAVPISAISIGDSRYGSQLLTWPIGATADSIPPDCYTSPIGWEFNFFTTEEQPTKYIYWLRTDPARDIFGGQQLGGFAVKLPHADSLYQTCSWIAHLTDGQEYEGVLQSAPVSVPPSSIEVHEGVEVIPNPGTQGTRIRYYSPSAVRGTVDIYDVRGRLVMTIPSDSAPRFRAKTPTLPTDRAR